VCEALVNHPERIVPERTERGIVAIHLKRYEFVRPLCANKEVLDAGCGVGYGTAHLAAVARRVVGVDIAADAIAYAREHYVAPNAEFVEADVLELPFEDGSFDVVCSFETIEHVRDAAALVAELRRVLRRQGTCVLSTPRVERTTHTPANPFHVLELSPDDFSALLRERFDDVELYGQRRLQTSRHRALQRLDVAGLRKRLTFLRPASRLLGTPPMADATLDDIAIDRNAVGDASEIVAVCR
jgi:SAM-dependent methyltransferase